MNLANLTFLAKLETSPVEETVQDPTAMQTVASIAVSVLPFVGLLAVLWFIIIRPQQKEAKKHKSLLENMQVADEVVTAGGIIGRVLSIKEDTVLLETGGDKTRIRILRSAISEIRTEHELNAK